MPCGQPCKEIIDGAAALHHSVTCMVTSITLNAANGGSGPPERLRAEFMARAEELARLAQRIAIDTPADGAKGA